MFLCFHVLLHRKLLHTFITFIKVYKSQWEKLRCYMKGKWHYNMRHSSKSEFSKLFNFFMYQSHN